MNIKRQIPDFRLPCLKKGDLYFAPLPNSDGTPLILCSLPHLTEKEAYLLEAHGKEVAKSGVNLAILLHRTFPSTESWVRPLQEFNLLLFVDPLKRLGRSLRLLHNLPLQRCESLIFDHQNLLKFRIFHEFNLRGFSTLLTFATTDLKNPPNLSDRSRNVSLSRNEDSRIFISQLGQSVHPEPPIHAVRFKVPRICV